LKTYVLDAGVGLKWAIPPANEPLSSESIDLLRRYVKGELDFIVPDIFWAEIGNVLRKGFCQGRWSKSLAEQIASEMQARNFRTVSSHALLNAALKIALGYDRPVYDCLYVALAVESGAQMITADERLANSVAAHLPVKWLGALQ
jgi:predicted nucleic acid-binding protein